MTTFTATWEASTGSVLLEITPTSSVSAILRSDANGVASVRTLTGTLPSASAIVTRDAECANGSVTYTVVDAGSGAEETLTVPITGPRLGCVVLPETLVTPTLVTGYTEQRESSTTVHWIIGRDDPIVSLGPLRKRTGDLTVWCEDYATAREVVAVYAPAEVVMLRQATHVGMDMYHVATGAVRVDIEDANTSPRRWKVTVPYAEVAIPSDDLRGTIGWDWTDVATTYSSWYEVAAAWTSWADFTAGPPA